LRLRALRSAYRVPNLKQLLRVEKGTQQFGY